MEADADAKHRETPGQGDGRLAAFAIRRHGDDVGESRPGGPGDHFGDVTGKPAIVEVGVGVD